MANTIACGDCPLYNPIKKPMRNGKGYIQLTRGHCLDRSIYAKGRPGNPVYPPRAHVKELPFNQHQLVIVRAEHVEPGCLAVQKGK